MSYPEWVQARLLRAMSALDLPEPCAFILRLFAGVELVRELAEEAQREDEHQRKGVVSWRWLAEHSATVGVGISEAEEGVDALQRWGIIQVVGQSREDPVLPGSSALRLSYAGRATLGLAPVPAVALPEIPADPVPWELWHASSREGLLVEAAADLGELAWRPLRVLEGAANTTWLAGQIAASLCLSGAAVVDAWGLNAANSAPLLEELLWRTRAARGRRLLLIPSPAQARVAARASGARLRWVELPLHGGRTVGLYDARLTEVLSEGRRGPTQRDQADAIGVPESELAVPVRVKTRWDDLLVSSATRRQLEQAMLHARYRLTVLPERWPDAPGPGYRLLLSGLPGTGKSMAAEALANALDRPLMRLDLSSVLSKWLGETEKFLGQIFDIAEMTGSVLVLDEAEALFRQRESSGEGPDGMRTVVSYLLVRLERFEGCLVATTNRTRDLDEAFFRRFDDYIVVPVPDEATRLLLWRRMLCRGVEHRADVDGLDLAFIARQFAISGGLVRGAALRALAWAEGEGRPLDTPVCLAALARELEKNDRSSAEVFVEPYKETVLALLKGETASA